MVPFDEVISVSQLILEVSKCIGLELVQARTS